MPETLSTLEARCAQILRSIANLNDMRPGSIVGAVWRCGKPTCHCAQPTDPGHGPSLRLTYKSHGRTVTQALPTAAAVRKAEQEIAEFRNYQQLSRELVEVSEQVYRLRPVEETLSPQEKNGRKHPARSHARIRAGVAHHLPRSAPERTCGPRSYPDGGALSDGTAPEPQL